MSRILFAAKSLSAAHAHEQTIICKQLFVDHVVGSWPMKRKDKMHRMIMINICSTVPSTFKNRKVLETVIRLLKRDFSPENQTGVFGRKKGAQRQILKPMGSKNETSKILSKPRRPKTTTYPYFIRYVDATISLCCWRKRRNDEGIELNTSLLTLRQSPLIFDYVNLLFNCTFRI